MRQNLLINVSHTLYPTQADGLDNLSYELRISRSKLLRLLIEFALSRKAEFLAWVAEYI